MVLSINHRHSATQFSFRKYSSCVSDDSVPLVHHFLIIAILPALASFPPLTSITFTILDLYVSQILFDFWHMASFTLYYVLQIYPFKRHSFIHLMLHKCSIFNTLQLNFPTIHVSMHAYKHPPIRSKHCFHAECPGNISCSWDTTI